MTAPVLIIEDDEALRELLQMILEAEGFSVETAANGKEALERMMDHPPSLVLLDMRMPIMDGWQFCHELARRGGPKPPIVIVTAASDPAARAREVDADAWLTKPFDHTQLLSLVRRMSHVDCGSSRRRS
jgi:CheY-like chemotaxis protein